MERGAGKEAEELLAEVLRTDVAAVKTVSPATSDQADLRVQLRDGTVLLVDVKTAAHPSPEQIARLVKTRRPRADVDAEAAHALPVLVADVLSNPVRQSLAEAGWGFFDRRGHLYIQDGPRLLELTVPQRTRDLGSGARTGIRGTSGLAVAFAHLLEPQSVLGVRELTRATRLHSPTSVGNARRALQEANLLEPDSRPVLPDLFWALAAAWFRPLHGLASAVTPEILDDLGHNTDGPYYNTLHELADIAVDRVRYEGVALGGDLAAELYGAPIVRTPSSPYDLYLPGEVVVSRLKRRCGEASHLTERVVGVHPFPVSLAARTRLAPRSGSHGFPLVHPLVVALDLAQDPARGREVLEQFEPSEYGRVW
jgi:hypothetical protein